MSRVSLWIELIKTWTSLWTQQLKDQFLCHTSTVENQIESEWWKTSVKTTPSHNILREWGVHTSPNILTLRCVTRNHLVIVYIVNINNSLLYTHYYHITMPGGSKRPNYNFPAHLKNKMLMNSKCFITQNHNTCWNIKKMNGTMNDVWPFKTSQS